MHARVTTWKFDASPSRVEEIIRRNRDGVLPAARQLEGFRGFFSLIDEEEGRALTLTLWETEEAERASEEAANRIRAGTVETTGIAMTSAQRYRVEVQDLAQVSRTA
jgi:heme-degrading monooxygenase HmoA